MTEADALALAHERAAGVCECIGGGCAALTHLPGVNRCTAAIGSLSATAFFAVASFADRADPENLYAVCAACAQSPRRRGRRVPSPPAPMG